MRYESMQYCVIEKHVLLFDSFMWTWVEKQLLFLITGSADSFSFLGTFVTLFLSTKIKSNFSTQSTLTLNWYYFHGATPLIMLLAMTNWKIWLTNPTKPYMQYMELDLMLAVSLVYYTLLLVVPWIG